MYGFNKNRLIEPLYFAGLDFFDFSLLLTLRLVLLLVSVLDSTGFLNVGFLEVSLEVDLVIFLRGILNVYVDLMER